MGESIQDQPVQIQYESAVECLIMAAQALNMNVRLDKLGQIKKEGDIEKDIEKIASKLGLILMKKKVSAQELTSISRPALGINNDGHFFLIGSADERRVIVFPPKQRGISLTLEQLETLWKGDVVLIRPKFNIENLMAKYNLEWFTQIIGKYKKSLVEIITSSLFLQLFGLITPLFTQVLIDKVLGNRGIATLDILSYTLVILYIFQGSLGVLRTYILTHTTNKLDMLLGTRLFRHLVSLPVAYFENRRVGDTMMRIGALNSIRTFLTGSVITTALDTLFSLIFIILMFWYSIKLTLLAISLLPIFILLNIYVIPIYRQRIETMWERGAESNAFLVEAITGMQTVKSLAIEPRFIHRWESIASRYAQATFDTNSLGIGVSSFSSVVQAAGNFAILWAGGYMVMNGEMTLGQLIAFQMLAGQASGPMMHLVSTWQSIQQTGLSMERLGDILHTRPETVLRGLQQVPPPLNGNIKFENVTFRYRLDHPPVLADITTELPAGCRIGIVGRSGSGKSTFTKLIQRLYQSESGLITIDGIDINRMEPAWLRRQIGVVMQDNYLFSGSVRENIALAHPGASMEEVILAAQTAGAHEFILELPEGYDTKVGERGTALSGGQRQRIAIARALLTNPRILIFDEATSALDYESERIIMKNLDLIAGGRTMLMIAHRLSTVKDCDRIIVIDRGRLIEQGSHDELLKLDGVYARLFKQQKDD